MTDETPRTECPNLRQHVEDKPDGYVARHEWARKKARTHRQERCPGCGLFVIWVRR